MDTALYKSHVVVSQLPGSGWQENRLKLRLQYSFTGNKGFLYS